MKKGKLFRWLTHKLSQDDIRRFCEENKTTESENVLIVHCDDMAYDYCFPSHVKANVEKRDDVQVVANKEYTSIPVEDNSYDVLVCTGLLEHVKNYNDSLKEMFRVLKPGGKIIISASASFSTHEAPNNFYHFTVFGLEHSLQKNGYKEINVKPSCKPFRTIAILIQRTCYQAKINSLVKIFLLLLVKCIPVLDFFIKEDYGNIERTLQMESSLYSNVQATAYK